MIEAQIIIIKKLIAALTALVAILSAQHSPMLGAISVLSLSDQVTQAIPSQRAQIKSLAISKLPFVGTYTDTTYGVKVEIQSIKEITGGIEIMARAWKGTEQYGFVDGTVEIERFRIFNPPILVQDPNGTIVRTSTDKITGEIKTRKLREAPVEAIQKTLAHTIFVSGKLGTNIVKGKIGNTTSTFFPDADPETNSVDGWVRSLYGVGAGVVWGTIRGDAGNSSNDVDTNVYGTDMLADSGSGNWRVLARGMYLFNTAAIADTDTIDSSTLSLYGSSQTDDLNVTPDINIYASNPTSNTSLTGTDYSTAGATAFSTTKTYVQWGASYNDFALNASGLTNISKTGVSKFSSRNVNYDVANIAPTWSASVRSSLVYSAADTAGTAQDPKLVVVHSAAAVAAPPNDLIIFE